MSRGLKLQTRQLTQIHQNFQNKMKIKKIIFIGLISLLTGLFSSTLIASALNLKTEPRTLINHDAEVTLTEGDNEQTLTCDDLDAWHAHGYENTTTPEEGYESYLRLDKLRIYLHDDFLENIDLDTI